jgi:hypothetical protein
MLSRRDWYAESRHRIRKAPRGNAASSEDQRASIGHDPAGLRGDDLFPSGTYFPELPEATLRSGRHNKAACGPNDLAGNPG